MPDKSDRCYYWHIVTLAKMKNAVKEIKKRANQKYRPKYKIKLFLKNIYKNNFYVYFITES